MELLASDLSINLRGESAASLSHALGRYMDQGCPVLQALAIDGEGPFVPLTLTHSGSGVELEGGTSESGSPLHD